MGNKHLLTVKEVSRLTGVSVRTLHHYDAIDLLKPYRITNAGYRLYDGTALRRLQNILMFRELQFSLKEIKAILDSPAFDSKEALAQQIKLLELRKKHLEERIVFARELLEKGMDHMDFKTFQDTEMDPYAQEAKNKWGTSKAYKEYEQKTARKTELELRSEAKELLSLFAEIGILRSLPPDDCGVQEKIRGLQAFITENYYHCTDEILLALSQMYVCDERMKHNIDQAGGAGTAEFVKQAVMMRQPS